MSIDNVVIKSSNGEAQFEFSERDGLYRSDGSEYYRVMVNAEEFSASTTIYAFHPSGTYCWQYFEDLATCWRGWDGKKNWSSLESDFSISAESDSLGHISLEVDLSSSNKWSAQINVILDSSQLEDISKKIKEFFSV